MAAQAPAQRSRPRTPPIAGLLFFSGLCALIYQMVWTRELRHVFGASTLATAAVLAVFMGGLGYGSHLLGKRADRVQRPLLMYAKLEGAIALCAAITPVLLYITRSAYIAVGGEVALGPTMATVARLLLSAVVLLPPTILMGGTLPAAARAAMPAEDESRRSTALLYGVNTLGAVTGAAVSTFIMFEVFGTRFTLWIACAINLLTAVAARMMDRRLQSAVDGGSESRAEQAEQQRKSDPSAAVPARFVLAAAAGVGFVFLLMELVWYRMLSPLLGGSSYTFGLILAVALLGIGIGGLGYALRGAGRPARLGHFALSCGMEALAIGIPFALGDSIAVLAVFLRTLGTVGLWGHVLSWTVITSVVVLPAAIIAGYQFPLLIALLGRAKHSLGRHVGMAYAFNTLGAIVGSLVGGFLLIPRFGCLGSWQLCVWVLVLLGAAAMSMPFIVGGARVRGEGLVGAALVLSLLMVHMTLGPTAAWRHSPIGAGRADDWVKAGTRNSLKAAIIERRRAITWDVDGRESTVGLYTLNDTSFLVNGKSDGAAVLDAGTQVMGGLLGALIHPKEIKRALVVGLGTGSTAGWLGLLPSVEAVDAVELEPAIVEVARICAPVNADVLNNPRVHIHIGDAREVLLTTPHKYDLIFSEPSNPYRAGVASLFTKEFYAAVHARLESGGVFLQWVQAYEIDARSVRTVYTTLANEFAAVETWRTKYSDLIMIARDEEVPIDLDLLKKRITEEPYRQALMGAWRVDTAEGVLAHFVAQPGLARAIAADDGPLGVNTDDRNQLEFSIARTLGRPIDNTVEALLETVVARKEDRPVFAGDGAKRVNWESVVDHMVSNLVAEGAQPRRPAHIALNRAQEQRYRALRSWSRNRTGVVLQEWGAQPRPPQSPVEIMIIADALALAGDGERAEPLLDDLETKLPVEALAIRARLFNVQGKHDEAWQELSKALTEYRTTPWANNVLMGRIFPLVYELTMRDRRHAAAAEELLSQELSLSALRYLRIDLRLDLGVNLGDGDTCRAAIDEYRGHIPWEKSTLERVVRCYVLSNDHRKERAEADLLAFFEDASTDFASHLIDRGAVRQRAAEPMPSSAAPTASGSAAPTASSSAAPAATSSARP